MPNEIQKPAEGGHALAVTEAHLEVVRNVIFPSATPEELQLFLYDCQRQGVHPLDKLLHPTKRKGKYVAITSIDLLRSRADATGLHAGTEDARFTFAANGGKNQVVAATVTVHKLVNGLAVPFSATAWFSEYCPTGDDAFMWRRMPRAMIAKCAEALALRRAFPRQLAGLYTAEEMHQAAEPEGRRPPPARGARPAAARPAQDPRPLKSAGAATQPRPEAALPPPAQARQGVALAAPGAPAQPDSGPGLEDHGQEGPAGARTAEETAAWWTELFEAAETVADLRAAGRELDQDLAADDPARELVRGPFEAKLQELRKFEAARTAGRPGATGAGGRRDLWRPEVG